MNVLGCYESSIAFGVPSPMLTIHGTPYMAEIQIQIGIFHGSLILWRLPIMSLAAAAYHAVVEPLHLLVA